MGLFNTILTKLGLKKEDKPATPVAAVTTPAAPAKPVAAPVAKPVAAAPAKPAAAADDVDDMRHHAPVVAAKPTVAAISEVDVVKKLEQMASGSELNWKVSIVDLLKVLGIDSSREARNELATELGCPADLMKDSAKMNVWLHKEVLKQIAQNGGNIPKDLLD